MNYPLTNDGLHAVFLFIAELLGIKSPTEATKATAGMNAYLTDTLLELDYSSEADRSDVHENIWLTRIYSKLDQVFGYDLLIGPILKKRLPNLYLVERKPIAWGIPIELDASASMLQYLGILLNDSRLCDMTNVLGSNLNDPWQCEGIPRTMFKHASTPLLYGSSKSCHELWQDRGHSYSMEQVHLFNEQLRTGALGVANQFKEFIINNCKPSEQMTVTIGSETFDIECNRYRHIGEKTTQYDIYDTQTAVLRRITHSSVRKVPDLEQFRRYFVTLLVHNLDSQVANNVIDKTIDKYSWAIDIHDAFIVHPNSASDVRKWYCNELNTIYANRKQILSDYFASIGIGGEAQAQWTSLQAMVHPIEGAFECQPMALK